MYGFYFLKPLYPESIRLFTGDLTVKPRLNLVCSVLLSKRRFFVKIPVPVIFLNKSGLSGFLLNLKRFIRDG